MTSLLHVYLQDLERQLHLERPERREILFELRGHIEDSARELMDEGISTDDAFSSSINELGETKSLARRLYEVHSQGTWHQTALAILPHVLLSTVFALGWWRAPLWVSFLLIVAVATTVFGWRAGRPAWTYPWLGYSIIAPIVAWGLAMSALGYGAWGVLTRGTLPLSIPIYVASLAYLAGSLWIIVRIVSKVAKLDWVMASLAVFPAPFILYWTYFFYAGSHSFQPDVHGMHAVNASAAIVFMIVAVATAVFLRVGRRAVRAALLLLTAPPITAFAWLSYQGASGYLGLLAFSAVSLTVLLGPAIIGIQHRTTQRYVPLSE